MKKMSRILLSGALALILLTAACAEATPTTIATSGPIGGLASPTALGTVETADIPTSSPEVMPDTTATIDTAAPEGQAGATVTAGTDMTATPGVPVTGTELTLLECQFCIEGMAHAVLVLPDTATFETVADTAGGSPAGPGTGCNTVDTYTGRQVVICRSGENTSLNLNICVNGNNCAQMLVELQPCPDVAQPGAPSTSTLEVGVPTNTAAAGVTNTPGVGAATLTPTP